jgi:hypothetical protein
VAKTLLRSEEEGYTKLSKERMDLHKKGVLTGG